MDGVRTRYEDTKARRWKVFVSSTGFGLLAFRDIARDVIDDFRYEGLRCFEPVMMEDFGAEDAPAGEVCAGKVQDCDILVGIVGVRYGDHPLDDQTSFTELEFEAARSHGVSRLMYLLDEQDARGLEGAREQGDDRADRQRQFRQRVARDRVSDVRVATPEDFEKELRRALGKWIVEYSFARAIVDHRDEFRQARERLLRLGERTGGATLIFGAPGTGKTALLRTLLNDVPLQRAYGHLIGPLTIRLADGRSGVERAREAASAQFDDFAGQAGITRTRLPPVLVVLHLESDLVGGTDVDPETLAGLSGLFTWDVPRTVVVGETNSLPVLERLERDLGWDPDAVITVRDYARVSDALAQMRRDAPDVREWPQPDTRILAEALGLRPISLYAAAKDIEAEARRAPRRVTGRIRRQLDAIAQEKSEEGRYKALIGHSIQSLSPEARDLLALMTVLHPKPTLFPDGMAVALNLSLDLDAAVAVATAEENDLDVDQLACRDQADDLLAELVERGLLERISRQGQAGKGAAPLLTLHPASARVIHDHLPLTAERRAAGHARAEAFYRTRIGAAVGGTFEERFRLEDGGWWDHAEEWTYHFSHMAPDRAGITFAALFFEAYWWWDVYTGSGFSGRLLEFAQRPRVQAISPEMPQVARLLAEFRAAYPPVHEAMVTRLHDEIASGAPDPTASIRATAVRAARVIPILRDLCGTLGITELDALFTGTPEEPGRDTGSGDGRGSRDGAGPGDVRSADRTRLLLLGLVGEFLSDAYSLCGELAPDGTVLEAAIAAVEYTESCFLTAEDGYRLAWARFLHGQVLFARGGDPEPLWHEAEAAGDRESDSELLANIERSRAVRLRARGDLDGALAHYGRAVFFGLAQITANLGFSADPYTQAYYREICLHATTMLAWPLLHDHESALDARLAEARRRLAVMLGEWGGSWQPDQGKLDAALRAASRADREDVEKSARAIADAAFPLGPGDALIGKPGADYYSRLGELIDKTRTQPWVKALGRWDKYRERRSE
jgi:Domain of unknown function (DUF4062)